MDDSSMATGNPENTGIAFGISTLPVLERELQLLPVWATGADRHHMRFPFRTISITLSNCLASGTETLHGNDNYLMPVQKSYLDNSQKRCTINPTSGFALVV